MELDKILERKQRIAAKKAGLEKKEQEMKTLERKARTRKLIELGNLISKADLEDTDPKILFGALQEIREKLSDEGVSKSWLEKGTRTLENHGKNSLERLIISFSSTPSIELKTALREKRFKWNPWRKEWYGTGKKEEMDKILSGFDANVEIAKE